jgi:hypothetical protein
MNILLTCGVDFTRSHLCDFIFYKKDFYKDDLEYIFKGNKIEIVNFQANQINLSYSIKLHPPMLKLTSG